MCRPVKLLWGVFPLAFLAILAHFFAVPLVERDVESAVSQALRDAGQVWGRVSVEGRDVTLRGTAPNQAALDSALASIGSADGVRVVRQEVILRVAPVN